MRCGAGDGSGRMSGVVRGGVVIGRRRGFGGGGEGGRGRGRRRGRGEQRERERGGKGRKKRGGEERWSSGHPDADARAATRGEARDTPSAPLRGSRWLLPACNDTTWKAPMRAAVAPLLLPLCGMVLFCNDPFLSVSVSVSVHVVFRGGGRERRRAGGGLVAVGHMFSSSRRRGTRSGRQAAQRRQQQQEAEGRVGWH